MKHKSKKLLKLIYRKFRAHKGYRLKNTVLVIGSGRSGTTWLMEMMNVSSEYRLVFEPFDKRKTNILKAVPTSKPCLASNDEFAYKKVYENILKGKVDTRWANRIKSSNIFSNKQIVKDIRLNRMVPWIQSMFPELKIVIIVRDPYSAAYSAAEGEWISGSVKSQMPPDKFMDEHFTETQRQLFEQADSYFQRNIAVWALENYLLLNYTQKGNVLSVYYENLVRSPEAGFKAIADFCGHSYQPLGDKAKKASTLARKGSVIDPSSKKFGMKWKGNISAEDDKYAQKIIKEFDLDKVYKERNVPGFPEPLEYAWNKKKMER